MSNVLDLFKGVGVIIDDDLKPEKEDADQKIFDIKKSFDDENVPLLTYWELPNKEVIHFKSVSFILLDWDLYGLGSTLPQSAINDNIEFIKQINNVCFVPIFIFSNESKQDIELKLTEVGLYDALKSNHIFVESKSELKNTKALFGKIEEWVKQTPSIYVLKEWDLALRKAKNSLFWDLYHINPEWAKVFYGTIKKDGGDVSYETSEILFENLKTRTLPVEFDASILSVSTTVTITPDEIKQVLEGQRFRKHNLDMIFTGDIFFKDGKYYINVRPQCDCIPRKKGQTIDDIAVYLIEAKTLKHLDKHYDKDYGLFKDKDSQFTVFPVNDKKAIQFEFKLFTVEQFKDWKTYRIGTLLPPFITRLIQKYVAYMQRQGLPRIPEEAIK
ncbi:MAG: hypothetical protein LBG45_07550 [Dysgonamonadaceae bacterium]|nr:hypothetical protein [Dysgonamonadaceae bacterium]